MASNHHQLSPGLDPRPRSSSTSLPATSRTTDMPTRAHHSTHSSPQKQSSKAGGHSGGYSGENDRDFRSEEYLDRARSQLPSSTFMMRPLLTEQTSDGSARFRIYKYPSEALTAIHTFWKSGVLCDVRVNISGRTIDAHKLVLAACSEYFRAMFTNGMIEASRQEVTLMEPHITMETLAVLVDFAYTGEIHVSQDNVQCLLVAAMFLEMRHVIEACTLYMEQNLDPCNCIGFAKFASEFGCLELEAKAKKFIHEHFCEVIKYDEFLTLEKEEMVTIVQHDALNIRCESQVFSAVVRWVQHDTGRRLGQLTDLLDKVRLSSLAPCFLESQLEKCTILRRIPHCEQLILGKLRKLYTHCASNDAPRKCSLPTVVYTVGGFYRKPMDSLRSFECWAPDSKEWTRLPDLPSPRCGPGVTSLKRLIYVLGGRVMRCGQSEDSRSLAVYDPATNAWSSRCPMGVARNRVGVAVLDEKVYAVGGCEGGAQHRSVERYDPDLDAWEPVSAMGSVRMSAGVAVLHRLLYAVGGFDGRHRLASVEVFHPEHNQWSLTEPLNEARSGAGVAVLHHHIYAVGGFNGSRQLATVERYDPARSTWDYVAPLMRPRSGVAVVELGGRLYAFGGYDGSDFLSCVESYNPDTNEWQVESSMLCARSGHGVVVERQPDTSVS